MDMWDLNVNSPWRDLDSCVREFQRESSPNKEIWDAVSERPFDKNSSGLLAKTWEVSIEDIGKAALCTDLFKYISLGDELKGYERDQALFHELMHAWYGEVTADGFFGTISSPFFERNLITEWLGRQARADPEILSSAIKAFKLTPEIYDLTSQRAFSSRRDKLAYFLRKGPVKYVPQEVFMD